MKKKLILIILGLATIFVGCSKDDDVDPDADLREWTIIGYFNGNNNLDHTQAGSSYIIGDVQEMEHAGSSEKVNSVIMLSSLKTGGNAKYYNIIKGSDQLPDKVASPMLEDMGSKDMSDPQTLIDFIDYSVKNYPAKRYMLILNSHGGGWTGVSPDEANGSGDMMSMHDLREAMETGPHFDVVVFHACLMSMTEVAYEIKDLADYLVASEISMPALSVLGADIWLKDLIENPSMSSYDLSKKIVQCVYNNGQFAQKTTHMAVTDLSKMDALGAKIANLGNKLTTEVQDKWPEVYEAWNETHYISEGYPSYTDLREFVKKIQQMPGLSQINYITQAGSEVLSAFNDAVPFTKSYLNNNDQPYGGLTIHFPQQEDQLHKPEYNKLKFKDTNWHNFLSIFIENTQGSGGGGGGGGVGADEVGFAGTISYPGHTLSNTCYVFVYTVENSTATMLGYEEVAANGQFEMLVSGITSTVYFAFDAIDDANNNEQLDPGEGFGIWDPDGNNVWDDILEAQPGNAYSGIDIVLYPYNGEKSQGIAKEKINRILDLTKL